MKKFLILSLVALALELCACAPVSKAPNSSDLQQVSKLVDQGTRALQQGDVNHARASFLIAREIVRSPETEDGLGCADFLAGKYKEAQQHFLAAYEIDPNYVTALANLALLYERLGYNNESAALYQQVLAADPKNFRARNNMAVLLAKHESVDSARLELQKAKALYPAKVIENNISKLNGD